MQDIKQKETNEGDVQTNENSDADNSLVMTRGKAGRGEVEKGQGGQIYDDQRRYVFGWQAHNVLKYKGCIIKLYA